MYLGYKYYETAEVEDPGFVYGTLDETGKTVEAGAVAYPFGYGLSYTQFTQEITDFNADGDKITLTVNVTNTGKIAGKDVVEVYYSAPYTDFDKEMLIEKPATELVAFDKTSIIEPNVSEKLTISFAKEDMASYCYTKENSDGTKGTFPKRPENDKKALSDNFANRFGIEETFDPENDPLLGNGKDSLIYTQKDNEVVDSGMFCYIKHFALNDQETTREFFLHTWATEQAAREIYLKAFEIPFKEAQMTVNYYDENGQMTSKTMRVATAIMASQNDIGTTIAHGNYALLTNVLWNG